MPIARFRSSRWVVLLAALLVGAAAACQRPISKLPVGAQLRARPWPAADRLFHQNPRWLGADDAHSVDLGENRVLWLFGDTFIDARGTGDRARADLIRNSIGIQTGSDPASATMAFFWRQTRSGTPASFFPESGASWLWPGDGIRIGSRLLLFVTVIAPADSDLGFTVAGWQALLVENPEAPPDQWRSMEARKSPERVAVALGTGGVLCEKGFLYAYGSDRGGQEAHVARWCEKRAGSGDLRDPEWWCGRDRGWKRASLIDGEPAVLFGDAQAEFGVHFEPRINQFVQVQTIGFGAASLGYRTAPRPEGPWGPLTEFYSPEESSIPGILIYAAKSHPFLTGAELTVTYATNHVDPERLIDDPALYYPRVLRGSFEPVSGPD